MKNNEFLQNAIGEIDDDLLTDAVKPIKKRNLLRIALVSAACFAIVLTALIPLYFDGSNGEPIDQSSEYIPPDDSDYVPKYAENLWDKSNFSALSIVYGGGAKISPVDNEISDKGFSSETAIESERVKIDLDSTIKVENLIANRYIVYYSDIGYPIIYDIEDGKEVDLTERIIGDARVDGEKFYQEVIKNAEKEFPGISSTKNNQEIIRTMVMSWMSTEVYDESAFAPDVDFLKDHKDYGYKYEIYMPFYPKDLYYIFYDAIWVAYCDTPRDDYIQKPYSIAPIWIDSEHGLSIVQIRDISGSATKTVVYDLVNDNIIQLSINSKVIFSDGYEIKFSNDGSFFTVTSPRGSINGANIQGELQSRYTENEHRTVKNYIGESYSLVYIDKQAHIDITDFYGNDWLGISNAYISENKSVVYYKLRGVEPIGKYFTCDKEIWYDRLTRFDSDKDAWRFCNIDGDNVKAIVLSGRFVKLACNETVAIMEREGLYYAYRLSDGQDITSEIFDEEYELLAHERLNVYYEGNSLYKKDIFDIFNGEAEKLIDCDSYILSNDGAFAFAYKNGDGFVTCINVATNESRRVTIDEELCNQIFADKNAVFKMNYNEEDNTLALSFYKSDEVIASDDTKDFYSLISQIDYNPDLMADEDILAQERTYGQTFKVDADEEIIEAIRGYVEEYEKYEWGHDPSVIYPLGFTPEDKYQDVLRKLRITPPDDYINMNGTCFILYEDEDEKIEFVIGRFFPIYDPPEDYFNNGLTILYTINGREYDLI